MAHHYEISGIGLPVHGSKAYIRENKARHLQEARHLYTCSAFHAQNGHSHRRLTGVNIVDDVFERRHVVDFRDVNLGWHGNAADVTRQQHGCQVMGRSTEYQPVSW